MLRWGSAKLRDSEGLAEKERPLLEPLKDDLDKEAANENGLGGAVKAADGSAALGRPNPADELLGPLEKEKEFPAPKGLGGDRCLFPLGAPEANNPNEDKVR